MNVNFSLSRLLCAIAALLFLVAAAGHAIGLTGNPAVVTAWGLFFFALGHVF